MKVDRKLECSVTGETYLWSERATIGFDHLKKMVEEAMEESRLDNLPYNLSGTDGILPYYDKNCFSQNGVNKVVKRTVRFCGWLKAAGRLPAVSRVLSRTQSRLGMNSPATTLDVCCFAQTHPSPGRLERKLWAVRRRADAIMSAYEGDTAPSWRSIAAALLVTRQVGKAAVMAVAGTLSGETFSMYREARQWLTEYHFCGVADESDGVISKREHEPRLEKFDMAVYRIAIPQLTKSGHQVNVDLMWLVRTVEGRTYHSGRPEPQAALKDALRAWKRQDELAAADADLVGFLNGDHGYCPLVIRKDSYQAGNCSSGTESWLRERGWTKREFIPAVWLVPYLDYSLVRNVAMQMQRQYTN